MSEKLAILVEESAVGQPRSLPLSTKKTTVGRSRRSDIGLSDRSVSREHAVIERRVGGFLLMDMGSRNGTRVNGAAVVRRMLRDGDRVAFGDVKFVFRECEGGEAPWPATLAEKSPESPTPCSADATLAAATSAEREHHWEEVNAWQIVRAFGSGHARTLASALQAVCDDIAGLRGVRRVVLHLNPTPATDGRAKWIKAGERTSRPGALFDEERLLRVARTGVPAALAAGRQTDRLVASEYDAVCVPVSAGAITHGCLYVEGESLLPSSCVGTVRSVAEAVAIGMNIWQSADSQVRAAEPGAPAAASIIGRSAALLKAVAMARKAATVDSTVLIRGETGTGKELFARLIYEESGRRAARFVTVHVSAIEETLMGSALFGHEKGAFTGAIFTKAGMFEEAHGGTLFLDEVGELSHAMQVKLLRVLQGGEFMKVGGTAPIRTDVRVIAATNRDLEKAVEAESFRRDLYYRLRVIELFLPPLRERRADVPELARHFLAELAAETRARVTSISNEAMRALTQYEWPGNVRELRNVMERCLVLAEGPELTLSDLPDEIARHGGADD